MIDPNMTNEELINLILVSQISADNPNLSESEKQDIMKRHKERPSDWAYIFEAIKDKKKVDKLVDLMTYLDTDDDDTDPLGLLEK